MSLRPGAGPQLPIGFGVGESEAGHYGSRRPIPVEPSRNFGRFRALTPEVHGSEPWTLVETSLVLWKRYTGSTSMLGPVLLSDQLENKD